MSFEWLVCKRSYYVTTGEITFSINNCSVHYQKTGKSNFKICHQFQTLHVIH